MSVLIKGMEMPINCKRCRLKINCDECEGWECFCLPSRMKIGYFDDLLADKRRDDCPLVPVQPHGRLIDADALKAVICEALKKALDDGPVSIFGAVFAEFIAQSFTDAIENAPTIIEAEVRQMRGTERIYTERCKPTNAEVIRAMSDEELAEWLANTIYPECPCCPADCDGWDGNCPDNPEKLLAWLKSEAEGATE